VSRCSHVCHIIRRGRARVADEGRGHRILSTGPPRTLSSLLSTAATLSPNLCQPREGKGGPGRRRTRGQGEITRAGRGCGELAAPPTSVSTSSAVGAARPHKLRRGGTMAGRRRLKGELAPTYGKCPRAVSYTQCYLCQINLEA